MNIRLDFKRYIWGEIAAAGISAAASIIGNRQRNEAQRRENERAFEREKKQIAEMNAYNSASAQVARLQAAGLNPNLMYGQTPGQAAGQQSDIAHYSPAEMQNAFGPVGDTVGAVANSLIGIREQENKNALAEADVMLKQTGAALNEANYHWTKVQGRIALDLLGYQKESYSAQSEYYRTLSTKTIKEYDEIDSRIEKNLAEKSLLLHQVDLTDKNKEYYEALIQKADADTIEVLSLLRPQREFLEAGTAERVQMVKNAITQRRVWRAQRSLLQAEAAKDSAEIAKWQEELKVLKSGNARAWAQFGESTLMDGLNIALQFYNPTGTLAETFGNTMARGLAGGSHHGTGKVTHGSVPLSPKKASKGVASPTGNRRRN